MPTGTPTPGSRAKSRFSSLWKAAGSVIFYNGGNVGIGTSTPGAPLDVNGNIRMSGSGSRVLQFKENGGTFDNALFYDNSVATNDFYIGRDSTNMFFRTGGASNIRATLVTGFNVGAQTDPGAGNISCTNFYNSGGFVRVSTQFDKTNDSTLATVTGLSVTLIAGKSYFFRAVLWITANATAGQKYAIAGTATATSIIYEVLTISNTTNTIVISSKQTALAGSVGQAGGTDDYTTIEGLITVNGGGTLTVQFAQNVATPATTSSVLSGSYLQVLQIT